MNTFPETLRTESSSDSGALEQLSLGLQEERDLMKASPLGEQKCHLCLFLRVLSAGLRISLKDPPWDSEKRNDRLCVPEGRAASALWPASLHPFVQAGAHGEQGLMPRHAPRKQI